MHPVTQLSCHPTLCKQLSTCRRRGPVLHSSRHSRPVRAAALDAHRAQDGIRHARERQLRATDLMAQLLQAQEPAAVAEEHLESLDESFFQLGNMFLQMAHKEGNMDVYEQIKKALQAAMDVKKRTLRPEIQLLNKLLEVEDSMERRRLLNLQASGEALTSDDGYFFSLLQRITDDVQRQPEHLPQRAGLLAKLTAIKEEANARLPRSSSR